ncbi:hypothetical protein HY031_02025 [Candidatus Gottesmanbacteria bacterium]|nr:hypothetical protein [Candidatus Gottesmanbacteria bacterium]
MKQILVDQWYRVPPGSIVSSREKWGAFTRAQMIIHPDWYAGLDPLVLDALKTGEINPAFFGPLSGDENYLVRLLDPDHLSYALAAARTWLGRLKTCAGNRPLYVIAIPSATMVAKDFFPYRHALKFTLSDALLSVNVDTFMKPLVESVGGRYVGLTDMFRQTHCVDCYFRWDRHLTPLGNRMVADALTPIMVDLVGAHR